MMKNRVIKHTHEQTQRDYDQNGIANQQRRDKQRDEVIRIGLHL
jgi:hypothetical protein